MAINSDVQNAPGIDSLAQAIEKHPGIEVIGLEFKPLHDLGAYDENAVVTFRLRDGDMLQHAALAYLMASRLDKSICRWTLKIDFATSINPTIRLAISSRKLDEMAKAVEDIWQPQLA